MPDTLEALRAELDYWEPRRYEGQPGSIWWEQVGARIEGLRHRENRILSVQPPLSVVNNLLGPNTRINHNSVDQSANLDTVDSLRRQRETRRFLAPELQRTIERVLYIHGRAAANFVCHSANTKVKPADRKQDFIPHWPSLYPTSPQVQDLSDDDAAALIAYYDSLQSLNDEVNDWWEREGQQAANLFNVFLHKASKCLRLALICIDKFELEALVPPPYESWSTISSRINQALNSEEQARNAHLARFEANAKAPHTIGPTNRYR